ncbi:hypothetical protein [Hydrogenophaga sp.]|uniref:hypothetical protein n=1 Tax=Hydrogenophaga sp. TaxID=1904254 RepID=UPI003F6BB905
MPPPSPAQPWQGIRPEQVRAVAQCVAGQERFSTAWAEVNTLGARMGPCSVKAVAAF